MVASKLDLSDENNRAVTKERALAWCSSNGNIPYFETRYNFNQCHISIACAFTCNVIVFSAKAGTGVADAFDSVANAFGQKLQRFVSRNEIYLPICSSDAPASADVTISQLSSNPNEGKKCC